MTERVTAAAANPPVNGLAPVAAQVFPGESEMARLMRAMDWARTPLGPVETWSQSLRMMARFLLANRFPLLLWWGPDFLSLYNDAYRPVLGSKHPQYLGRPVRECWSEVWDVIGPLIETPFNGGPATWSEDLPLELQRHGYVEEAHFTIAYSPVPDETAPNGIGGVLATVHEISEKVVGDRRVLVLRDLGARAGEAKTAEGACQIAAETLAHHPKDIPFALLYLIDADGQQARLAATTGIARESSLAPAVIPLKGDGARASDGTDHIWPLAEVARGETSRVVDDLASRGAAVPPGPWSDPPSSAVVVPIRSNIAHQLAGLMVAGVSARLRLDDTYAGFYELVSSQIATAIANARAYEEERKRAEALAEIDRAKTAFFSNVSHEFRTPLTLMLGPLGDLLAENGALPADAREQVEVVQRNGLRLAKLVNTLLDFSRIEAGRAQASYVPTDLAALTADLASAFRSLIERAGLRFVVDCPPLADALPQPVYVDRDMWEKIVLNLLSNAFKFTFAGEIAVTLRVVDGEELMVELEVRDTGTGIPAAELPRLFERFHRVQGARARTFEGSGIGLALVRELVHLHDGAIRVESAEGVGTSVFVRLPVGAAHLPADRVEAGATLASTALGSAPFVREAERWLPEVASDRSALSVLSAPLADEIAEHTSVARTSPGRAIRPARVLLADDNADMRDYLRRLLGERYAVEAVANGAAALAAIRRNAPDLVLADVMMPELDGFGLLRALRDDPATRAIPVLLLSARTGEEATVEGLDAGADDYLVKPFSAREVLSRVAARLEIARVRREVDTRARELETTFEAMADGVVIYDQDGHLVRWNAALAELFEFERMPGYADMPVASRPVRLRVRDERDQPIPAGQLPFMRAARGEILMGTHAVDLRVTMPSGRHKQVNVTAAPLHDASGQSIGAIAIYRDVTERRRMEREARWQASMLERAHDAIFMWELGGPIVYWNRGAELLYGFTRDEALGRISHELLHTRLPLPAADFEATLQRAGEWTGELTHMTRDGRQVIVLSRHQLLTERDGRRYVLESSRDITEWRRLERAARESAERLRAILDLLPVGVAFVDVRGKAEIVNQAVTTIWGKDIPMAQTRADFGHYRAWWPQTGMPVAADEWGLARALAGGEVTIGAELDIEAFDGTRKTILDSDAPLRDETGAIVGAMSVIMDITERKRLERRTHDALEALLRLADAIVSVPGDSAETLDDSAPDSAAPRGDETMRRLTALCCQVLASERVSIMGLEPGTELLRPIAIMADSAEQDRRFRAGFGNLRLTERFGPAVTAQLKAGETVLVDVKDLRADDPTHVLSRPYFLMAPMLSAGGLIGYIGVSFGDEARQYTAENRALALAVAQLVGMVMERGQLLREREDSRLRELAAAEANRRMNDFLGIASHELRTPLTSVTANVQMAVRALRRHVVPEADGSEGVDTPLRHAHDLLQRAERQIARLDRLVGDLLDVSRIEAGKLELRWESCDLLAIVREAVEAQRPAWPKRDITLALPRRARAVVRADADRIGQVVTNYLTNALKYSPADQPVAVRVRAWAGGVRVEVRDRGPGLTVEQREHLFERFSRAPGIEQQSGSGIGLGLGLYIARTIVERHGGAVGVESVSGAGSMFWFTLPLERAASHA